MKKVKKKTDLYKAIIDVALRERDSLLTKGDANDTIIIFLIGFLLLSFLITNGPLKEILRGVGRFLKMTQYWVCCYQI